MAKRIKETEDRLSDLPDSILIHILSMMCENSEDSKKVVRTSLLSTRWRFLWMSVPVSLDFRLCEYDGGPKKSVRDFVTSTHRELLYWRSCLKIKKFYLDVDFPNPNRSLKDLDLWVCFASKLANVEHFKLRCESGYEFPQFAYTNTSWRKLDLQYCELNPLANVNWSGIVSLSLRYMYGMTDGVMEKVLSGCPNLECLELYLFYGVQRLEISNVKSRKLIIHNPNNVKSRKFIIHNSDSNVCDRSLEILAPYIQDLKILGLFGDIYLRNVTSLVTAVLNFDFDFNFDVEDSLPRKEATFMKELFHSIAHVEKLELGPLCIEYLSILELEGWQPPPSSWKFLKLSAKLNQLDFPGICSFLQSSSDLETLVIDGYKESGDLLSRYSNEDKQTRRFETHNFNGSFPHLKTIKILNFDGSVLPLVKYLLEHTTVLEKFVIVARRNRTDVSPDYVKMEHELLSFPRSSPQASVIFSCRNLGPLRFYESQHT